MIAYQLTHRSAENQNWIGKESPPVSLREQSVHILFLTLGSITYNLGHFATGKRGQQVIIPLTQLPILAKGKINLLLVLYFHINAFMTIENKNHENSRP